MLILGIDTSNAFTSVSISKNNEILNAVKDFEENKQAERLISVIENLLKDSNLEYSDLDYLAACSGPGSFTGIRIGLAASNGISIACPKLKTVNVTNFETINFRIREQYTKFDYAISCVNAFRGEIYAEIYDRKSLIKEYTTYSYGDLENLINELKGNVAIAGSGVEKLYNSSKMPSDNIIVLPRFAYPDARFICKVAHKKITRDMHNDCEDLVPLYIRKPDAKVPTKLI